MKKFASLILALMVCLAAAGAVAETIPVKEMLLDNGLCFVAPSQWEELELTDEDFEEGYLVMLMDVDSGRCMGVTMDDVDEDTTNQQLMDELNADSAFLSAQLVTNEHDTQMVLYAYADETVVGYALLDGEGNMYHFSFMNAEGKKISGDDALLALVDTCMAATYLDEEMALYTADDTDDDTDDEQITAQGSVQLTMVGINDGPNFPIPAQWEEVEMTDEEKEDGCIAAFTDEASGRTMVVMANEVGNITTEEIAEVMQDDDDYLTARLMTNSHGLDMILFVTADQLAGGYCFADDDGWMYAMMYGLSEDQPMTGDEVLAQLVQDCMDNTYFD